MDITKKIKSLVVRQGSKSPVSPGESIHVSDFASGGIVVKNKDETWKTQDDPSREAEIIDSIEEVYYSNDGFDASEYELKKLPGIIDLEQIHSDRQKLRRQLHVVSKRVLDLILQKESLFKKELQRATELQLCLEEASKICAGGRMHLNRAKKDFTSASLGILASYRKREQLRRLLRSLYMIKTLQETDVRLRELLEEEDYPGAIQLCLECQKAACTFRHYHCISELSSKLQDTLVMTEEQVDVALSKVCTNFDATLYMKLQLAYRLLGKTQSAMDQLLMHFASAIHNKAFSIVLGYVELCAGGTDNNFHKRQYSELCKRVTTESFIPCLTDLCRALWEVMLSYWCIVEWHEEHDNIDNTQLTEESSNPSASSVEANLTRSYVQQKLEHGLLRIWQDVQQKLKIYLQNSDLSSFKFDEFICVLNIVRKMIDIGEEFCRSKSEELQESLHKQTVNYFRSYHRGCMDELRMFLENESWALCPVRANFTIVQLQEFRFLRHSLISRRHTSPSVSPSHGRVDRTGSSASLPSSAQESTGYFRRFRHEGNPFDIAIEEEEREDVLAGEQESPVHLYDSDSDDSDIPEELKKDYVDEQTGEVPEKKQVTFQPKHPYSSRKKNSPVITNTTLNVLRLFGKYMQMMNVLKPIAFDVFMCLSQLFDYYMYSVYSFFVKSTSDLSENCLSNKLRTALKRIRENLILEDPDADIIDPRNRDKVFPANLSPLVNLTSPEQLFGLAERVAAVESLVVLAEQLEFLQQYLESMIPAQRRNILHQLYSQTINAVPELRRPAYVIVSAQCIDRQQVLNLMSNVKWDIDEIMSQHSAYVDVLLRELQMFSMRLSEVNKCIPIPKEAHDLLWEHCLRLANRTFIEGFSQAKRCTNEGRALMQLDYQQFLTKVEHLVDLRPIPERELVDGYVKAYYLLETHLEHWIRSHKEYTKDQLISLIHCVTQLNRKSRNRLLNLIEEEERTKK